jgi:hypothetical protein
MTAGAVFGSFCRMFYVLKYRILAGVALYLMVLPFARGQGTNAPTNFVATPGVLFMTSHSNLTVISKAVDAASGLRVGMTEREVAKHLERHGMPGMAKLYSATVDRGRTWYTFYPLAGECSLGLQMRSTNNNLPSRQVTIPANKNKVTAGAPSSDDGRVLERAFIWSQGVEVRSITFTNGR